ncbi:MAG: DUF6311 domain-containing protein [Candidatus Faecousia sp.]|nr:DUF6311 domain-containing protein [Candidatus Faecousia sp.]
MINKNKDVFLRIVIGATIGILAFIAIYGTNVLDVTNDRWILSGYAEWDVQQHYAGWLNFNNSSWEFPLGQADKMGYPADKGVNISFTDSLPLVSIFFKALSPLFPEHFQWFGLYELFTFSMQGIAAMLLLACFSIPLIPSTIGGMLLCLSPIMIERSFRHIALSSHYIILFALLVYFLYRKSGKYPWKAMMVLSILSVGITPYFLPMVMIFVLALCVDNVLCGHSCKRALAFFSFNILVALTTAFCLGSIGNGYSSSRDGYGFYSMNLNALINPSSQGGYVWSRILPVRHLLYGQYDGFNYVGAGVLFLIGFVLTAGIYLGIKKRFRLKDCIQNNITLVIVSVFLTAFAASNVVCFDQTEIARIPMPDFLEKLCGIFRASSRMFYPVFYLIIIAGIVMTYRFCIMIVTEKRIRYHHVGVKIAVVVLLICLSVQCYDIGDLLSLKHSEMQSKCNLDMNMPMVLKELDSYEYIFVSNEEQSRYQLIIAGYNKLSSNGVATSARSLSHWKTSEYTQQIHDELSDDILRADTVYSTIDLEEFNQWKASFSDRATFAEWNMTEIPNTHIWENSKIVFFMMPNDV